MNGGMRGSWQGLEPVVYSYLPWQSEDTKSLAGHPCYYDAKLRRDPYAAKMLVEGVATDSPTVDALCDLVAERSLDRAPMIVVPSLAPDDNCNALALGYGKWLAAELEWGFCTSIFKGTAAKRDFSIDNWYRLMAQPSFYGSVEDRPYVIVDDLFHMGGTVASLRGFIEGKGGSVIAVSTLAHGGFGNRISLANNTSLRLTRIAGLADLVMEEMGYGIDCLTEPEGQVILRAGSIEQIREGIGRGRDACAGC